jgi:hypothetical protein
MGKTLQDVPDGVARPQSDPLRNRPVLLLGPGQLLLGAEGFVALDFFDFFSMISSLEFLYVRQQRSDGGDWRDPVGNRRWQDGRSGESVVNREEIKGGGGKDRRMTYRHCCLIALFVMEIGVDEVGLVILESSAACGDISGTREFGISCDAWQLGKKG